LALGAGGNERAEVGEALVSIEDGQVFFECGAAFGFGEGAELGCERHGFAS
jgi:hypothetical protein